MPIVPSVSSVVAMRCSGPKRESAVAVVNSFVFEASGRCRFAARAQTALPLSASTTNSPLAAPPP